MAGDQTVVFGDRALAAEFQQATGFSDAGGKAFLLEIRIEDAAFVVCEGEKTQRSFALIQLGQASLLDVMQNGIDEVLGLHGTARQAHQLFVYALVCQKFIQGHRAGERAVHLGDAAQGGTGAGGNADGGAGSQGLDPLGHRAAAHDAGMGHAYRNSTLQHEDIFPATAQQPLQDVRDLTAGGQRYIRMKGHVGELGKDIH